MGTKRKSFDFAYFLRAMALRSLRVKTVDELEDLMLLELLINKANEMDKKMALVTKQMKTAEKDVKAGKKAAAVKALKGAEKKNVKLTAIDRNVRDPFIDKCKKAMKKAPAKKAASKAKK